MVLYSFNLGGNVHQSCDVINSVWPHLAQYVLSIESMSGTNSIIIMKLPADVFNNMKEKGVLP